MFTVVKESEYGSPYVVDTAETVTDALDLARIHAQIHYDRTMNDTGTYKETATGAKFVTNNGTLVIYSVGKGS